MTKNTIRICLILAASIVFWIGGWTAAPSFVVGLSIPVLITGMACILSPLLVDVKPVLNQSFLAAIMKSLKESRMNFLVWLFIFMGLFLLWIFLHKSDLYLNILFFTELFCLAYFAFNISAIWNFAKRLAARIRIERAGGDGK